MKHLALAFSIVLLATGCTSKNDPTEAFDKTLNVSTNDKSESVGLKGDKVMVKKKVYLEEQLYKMQSEIEDLELAVYGKSKRDPGGIYEALRDCRTRISDARVGGSGKSEPMEKWERITQVDEDFQYKADSRSNMIGYSEEELDQRLVRYQKQKRVLDQQYENFKDRLDSCEGRYQTALLQHGLNPNDTKAQGEWIEGPNGYKVWKMRHGATKDPEELMRRKEKKN